MSHPLRRLVIVLVAGLIGCGADDDRTAGTGSSGGNPATVTFALTGTEGAMGGTQVEWQGAVISAARLEFARTRGGGECTFLPGEAWTLDALLELDRSELRDIDVGSLCRLGIRPSPLAPLLRVTGSTGLRGIILELALQRGVDVVFDAPIPLNQPTITVVLDLGALVRGLDLRELAGVVRDDSDRGPLASNLVAAVGIFARSVGESGDTRFGEQIGHLELAAASEE